MGHLADGMTVFVPRTAPGDRVALARVRRRRRHARAEAAQLLEPGPGRSTPVCRHFAQDNCGGCQWQHLSLEAQHGAKRRMVGDALRRIGALAVEDPELIPSPRAFGYRATITLTVRWRAGEPVVGFHRATGEGEQAGEVFSLERCEIARPEIAALWDAVRPALSALPRGEDVRFKLRVAHDGGLHLVVHGGDRAWTTPQPLAEAALRAGCSATVWWQPSGGAVRRMCVRVRTRRRLLRLRRAGAGSTGSTLCSQGDQCRLHAGNAAHRGFRCRAHRFPGFYLCGIDSDREKHLAVGDHDVGKHAGVA